MNPVRTPARAMPLPWVAAGLAVAVLGGSLGGCFGDTATGGTDEVENPALTATLRDADGAAVAGTVQVYARFQNPLRDSLAMLDRAVGADGAEITSEDLLAGMDSSAKAGVPWTNRDSVAFNLVGTSGGKETFQAEYLLVKEASGNYAFKRLHPAEGGDPLSQGSLSTQLPLQRAVSGYAGSVGARGRELGLQTLFVPGSPYKAPIRGDGTFTIARIASGRYDVKAVDGDGKVYASLDSLSTGAAFAPEDWSEADVIWVGIDFPDRAHSRI